MKNINKGTIYNYLTVCLLLMIVGVGLFRIEDPYKILLFSLIILGVCMRFNVCVSKIDITLAIMWLIDTIRWWLYPGSGVENIYNTTLCFIGYLLLRNMLDNHRHMVLFLKFFCLPAGASLFIALVSFVIFKDAVYSAGFIDIYPFRFLFHPLGHITNLWSIISLLLVGIFAIGYVQVPKWKWIFAGLWISSSMITLLTFSRGAYIAWGINAIIMLFVFDTWRKKVYFFILCFCIVGTIGSLFPSEFLTTCAMQKTISQRQSTESRLKATECAIKTSLKNKWLGNGNNSYLLTIDKDLNQDSTQAYTSYAPNIIVQIIVEKGWIGLIIYSFLVILIVSTIRKKRHYSTAIVIGGAFLSFCVKELTMSVILNNYLVLFLFYIILGFLQIKEGGRQEQSKQISVKLFKYTLLIGGSFCFVVFEIYTFRHIRNEYYNQTSITLFNKGDYQEAIRSLKQTSEQTPYLINRIMLGLNLPDSLLHSYQLYMDHSIQLLEQNNKEDVCIKYLQAKMLEKKEEKEAAYNILHKLVSRFPKNALFQYELFVSLYDKGMISQGCSHLEKALLLLPSLIHLPKVKKLKETQPHLFLKMFKNLISSQDDIQYSSSWYARCGYLAYHIGDEENAKKLLIQSVKKQPSFSIPWLLLGKLYEKDEQRKEASICFRKYNLLARGAFSDSSDDVRLLELKNIQEHKVLLQRYALKFEKWYHSNLFLYDMEK